MFTENMRRGGAKPGAWKGRVLGSSRGHRPRGKVCAKVTLAGCGASNTGCLSSGPQTEGSPQR